MLPNVRQHYRTFGNSNIIASKENVNTLREKKSAKIMKIRYKNAPQNLFAEKRKNISAKTYANLRENSICFSANKFSFFRKYFCIFAEFRYKTHKCEPARIFTRVRRLRELKKLRCLRCEFLHSTKTKTR